MGNKEEKGEISRRKLLTLLATTLGGAAVFKFLNDSNLAQKISPIDIPKVRAADGDPVLVGGDYDATSTTSITGNIDDAISDPGFFGAIVGNNTGDAPGISGQSTSGCGVYGWSTLLIGVYGHNVGAGAGVVGHSGDGVGVQGFGNVERSAGAAGIGIRGVGSRIGVKGESSSSSNPAIKGENTDLGPGVSGISNGDGVRGKSNASTGSGVGIQGFGNVSETDGDAGTGVRGVGSNIGIKAESSSGTALHVEGKNYFKSAQRTTIPTDVRTHDITVPSGITIDTDAMIFVTIMNNSSNIGVRWVERLSSDQFRVHLTGLSRNVMDIGYFIVN